MPAEMKHVIAETLVQMVKHQNVDKITATALIRQCHISRQTFYYHFKDLMDVYEWSIRQITQELVSKSLEAADTREALKLIIAFAVKSYPLMKKLLDSQKRAQLEVLLVDAVREYLQAVASHKFSPEITCPDDLEILLQFTSFGLVGVMLSCGGKPSLDQEHLVSQLEKILIPLGGVME